MSRRSSGRAKLCGPEGIAAKSSAIESASRPWARGCGSEGGRLSKVEKPPVEEKIIRHALLGNPRGK